MTQSKILIAFICFLLFSCSKENVSNIPVTAIERTSADTQRKVVVILGSSTAYGTGATPVDSGWVNKLRGNFRDEGRNIAIYNLALGGYTTYHIMPSTVRPPAGKPSADLARNVDKALTYKPDLIIINLPSNDVSSGFSDQEIINNYQQITDEIKKYNIEFLVTSTQPRNYIESNTRLRLATLNDLVRNILPQNIVDFYPLLADESNFIKAEVSYGDGIHLNNRGHRIIFEEFLRNRKMRLALGY